MSLSACSLAAVVLGLLDFLLHGRLGVVDVAQRGAGFDLEPFLGLQGHQHAGLFARHLGLFGHGHQAMADHRPRGGAGLAAVPTGGLGPLIAKITDSMSKRRLHKPSLFLTASRPMPVPASA